MDTEANDEEYEEESESAGEYREDEEAGDDASADSTQIVGRFETGSVDGSDAESSTSRRSRAPSPTDSLVAHAASLSLGDGGDKGDNVIDSLEADAADDSGTTRPQSSSIKDRVATEVVRQRARQAGKYHAKRGARKAGRPKGSKAKQDTRVRVDRSGVWE